MLGQLVRIVTIGLVYVIRRGKEQGDHPRIYVCLCLDDRRVKIMMKHFYAYRGPRDFENYYTRFLPVLVILLMLCLFTRYLKKTRSW